MLRHWFCRVEIEVGNNKLKAALEDDVVCHRRFGKEMSRTIRRRMDALHAADSLHDFWPPKSKPERVHELSGQLEGTFSVDLKQPFRLLFRPTASAMTETTDQQDRWRSIKKIEILTIEDTHG